MPNNIPGVVLPGDLEYKNNLLVMPKEKLYTPHQSRLFWLTVLGRAFTSEDVNKIADNAGGQLTTDYLTPEFLEKQGFAGLVLPSLEANFKDEKKTIYNWEEHDIDDNAAIQGTFTAAVAAPAAGVETTFTAASTTKLRKGRLVRHLSSGMQLRVSSVDSATQFKAFVFQNDFTSGSTFPGTDAAGAGSAVANNDAFIILSHAQEVAGFAVNDEDSRPVQRRNAFQTVAYELEKSGHAVAEDGTHATMTTDLDARRFQLQYRALCGVDDSMWFNKYARGVQGTQEVYGFDGIKENIGTTSAITDFGAGTTLTADKIDEIVAKVTKVSKPEDIAAVGNSTIAQVINKLGRANTSIEVEPGATEFGTAFLRIHTHRGTLKYFEMPESKTLGDTDNVLRFINTRYVMPVVRKGRELKWERDKRKDGTQDAMFDVYRGDISVATMHKEVHHEITGITG